MTAGLWRPIVRPSWRRFAAWMFPRYLLTLVPLLAAASPAQAIWPFDGAARRRQERVEAEAIAADRQLGRQTVEDASETMAVLLEAWQAAEAKSAAEQRAGVRKAIARASATDDHAALADQVLRYMDLAVGLAESRARMHSRVGSVAANLEYRQQLSERLQDLQGRRRLRADDAAAVLVDVIRGLPRHTTALPAESVRAPVTTPSSAMGISIPARVSRAEVTLVPLVTHTEASFRASVRQIDAPALVSSEAEERAWVQDQHDYRYECGAGSPGCTGGDQERRDQP